MHTKARIGPRRFRVIIARAGEARLHGGGGTAQQSCCCGSDHVSEGPLESAACLEAGSFGKCVGTTACDGCCKACFTTFPSPRFEQLVLGDSRGS